MNLASIVATHARGRPEHPAIDVDGSVLTYREASARIVAFAARLSDAGIGAGDRVGLCLKDTADHLLLHYAVAWLGATIVPIDVRWTPAEKISLAAAFGCKRVVVEPDEAALAQLPALVPDAAWRHPAAPAPAMAVDRNLAIVLSLSSGTTGRPTGALVSHGQLYERFVSQWVGMGFNATDRTLLATPLYFGGGRSFAMSALAAGGSVVMTAGSLAPEAIIGLVAGRSVTAAFLVPTQIGRLIEAWSGEGHAFPGMRRLVTSGSAMQPADRRRVMARLTPNLIDYYATSEGGGITVLLPAEQDTHADTVGRPAFRVEVEVVGEDGRPVPAGAIGQLRYRGPGVSSRLVDSSGRVTEAAEGGWFAPGDLALLTPSGHVRLVGRAKDVIIRGGVNIYPAEVEAVIARHPAVREVCVFAVPDKDLGEVVAAGIVAADAACVNEADILAFVRERLAAYKVPQRFVVLEALPRNTSGKVVKAALAGLLQASPQA
ncbi:MAG: class I adenylate-forming enzyme family protein [Hyphomicrobiaceae bacterium]|nr:class I adenylate-forming enzyme family protein [Hyphomicrobiaceae bacterium]